MAERTKIWIADKMKELMKTKPLDKIRVTEICRVAEIERPTFYYHFKDKYDLVAWIFLSDAYNTDVISAESAAQGMVKMRQEFIFYKRAYDDVSQNALWQYMLEYFVKRYEVIAKEKLNTDVLDTQLKFSIRLYCYGTVGMTKEWLLNDNTTSAETVVQMMFESMPQNMKEIYFWTYQRMIDATPMRRVGSPDEIGAAGAFLLSDAVSYVTGTDQLVDGGTIAALKNKKFQLGR